MKIYVGNMLPDTTRRSLKRIFSAFGKVRSTKITPSVFRGSDGAFGMVDMRNKNEGKQAIGGLDGSRLDGMTISASEALVSHVHVSGKKGHKKTALIIDEDSSLATGLTAVLKEIGCNTVVTFLASDLREISETIKPDLVIVNLRHPREMGFSIIANMKNAFPSLPVVAISAEKGIFGEEELKNYGVDAFITQPLEADQLRTRVLTLLEDKQPLIRSIEVIMPCKLGLHLRVAARFVKCVQPFHSVIRVRKGNIIADGKSIVGLLVLAAAWKSKLHIEVEGVDAKQTIESIKEFFQMEKGRHGIDSAGAKILSDNVYAY